jgi:hypothetical protein
VTMTAPAPVSTASQYREAVAQATEVVTGALTRASRGRAPDPQLAAALGRALARSARGSEHRKLLAAALRARKPGERTPEERAVWWLARRGETPTPGAVATRVAEDQRRQERAALVEQLAHDDGLRAAVEVARTVRRTGAGPTWRELARALGWPDWAAPLVIPRLESAGWLAAGTERGSLRPGKRSAS